MQLTKGAIGNLINRYRAVLKKCHLLNVFGSLAVAGMLVMGGAAAAGAAEWDGTSDLTLNEEESLTINNQSNANTIQSNLQAASQDITISIKGGTLKISSSNGVTGSIVNNNTTEGSKTILHMTDGTLNVAGRTGTGQTGDRSYGIIQVQEVQVIGGTVNLGPRRQEGYWDEGMLLSYSTTGKDTVFSGADTTVNINGGSLLSGSGSNEKQPSLVFKEGVTVNLSGASLDQAALIKGARKPVKKQPWCLTGKVQQSLSTRAILTCGALPSSMPTRQLCRMARR